MPVKPELKEKTPEQLLADQKLTLQLAYDLAKKEKAGKYGPEGQKLFDFINAMTSYGNEATEGEKKRQKETRSEEDEPIEKRERPKNSYTRGEVLKELSNYRSSLLKLNILGRSLHEGNYEKAKKQLPFVVEDLDNFTRTYRMFKESMPEMIPNDPVLEKFDRLWEERNCPVGEQLLDRLEGKNLEQPLQIPEEPEEFIFNPDTKVKEEDVPNLQINNETIRIQREADALISERHYRDVYAPGNESYEGVLGTCEKKWNDRDQKPVSGEALLAMALAAAQLRKEGVPFQMAEVQKRAAEITDQPAFSHMVGNKRFLSDCLSDPRKMDDVLKVYEQEVRAMKKPEAGEKSYEGYLRRHTWPNVPEGKEQEYLAKAIAARRLQEHGTPFDLSVVREEANELSKQTAFQRLTKPSPTNPAAEERVRRWLHGENLATADSSVQALRRSLRSKNSKEPSDPNVKSWAGYRRMHTGENVPQNASHEEKQLYLAKAMVAVRGMSDDKPFNLKSARKAAAALVKNKYFKAITRDPQKLSEVLASGKVTSLFQKMYDARRKAMGGFSKEKELMEYRKSIAPLEEENSAGSRSESESELGSNRDSLTEEKPIGSGEPEGKKQEDSRGAELVISH